MDPRRALSKLTAQTTPLEQGTGGRPEVTAADVAAACAGLRISEWLVVAAKWVQPTGYMDQLFASIYSEAVELADQQKWRVPPDRQYVERMTSLAILEVLKPATCRACRGTGYRQHRPCKTCDSTGHRRMSGRQRAKIVGMDHKGWQRHWAHRYERIYRRVAGMETSALAHIAKRLNEWD